ncbi:MAG: MFS transporter [Bacteroidetes bacterium]|jgi:FHS family L-fucose permease-like MFS transporter|nr:MFS transporter [Bacteroidota bacterium]
MEQNKPKGNSSAFFTLTIVFFFWGFVAASNDILIPVFKEKLHLQQWQSQMISFAFYVAYTVGAIIYSFISKLIGGDILNKLGYKNGIVLGLIISTLGALMFYPAAQSASFALLITGLFIIGLGYSLQQTAANPLAIIMGNPKTGSQRLNLAGGVNNFGTTIGPVLVSLAIFGSVAAKTQVASIESVKYPYLVLGALFIVVALIFKFSSVPNKIEHITDEDATTTPETTVAVPVAAPRKNALKYPQLALGMIAIFVYVGVEVSTASNLPEFMKEKLHTATGDIAPFVSLYWASLMIGRWTASVGAFNLSGTMKKILNVVMPYIAFIVFLLINLLAQHDVTPFYIYPAIIVVMIIGDMMSKGNPARQLLISSTLAIVSLAIGILTGGMISVYAFISVGLFCSTLWPSIYALAIAGLGTHTNEGSGYLIMMIMGGGIISLFQGYLASPNLLGIQLSYIVGIMCFAYLAFYAVRTKAVLIKQGIDFDAIETGAGH